MDFKAARFQGNAILLDILNDPDTGTLKLQENSDVESVRTVQQAFWDLDWPYRIHLLDANGDQIPHDAFVDGDYGPWTKKVVVAYKRRYNIHFPPSNPDGLIDGYTGPRTLRQLDMNAESLELVMSSIVLKRAELNAAGVITTPWDPGLFRPEVIPVPGREGGKLPCDIDSVKGAIYHCTATGAFEIHGPIYDEYVSRGGATGVLGFPVSDLEPGPTPDQDQVRFEHGTLVHDRIAGAVMLDGAVVVPPNPPF